MIRDGMQDNLQKLADTGRPSAPPAPQKHVSLKDFDGQSMTFKELQFQNKMWADHNFPGNDWTSPMLGLTEELGELAHAFLKQKQKIRGTSEEHEIAGKDAVGDLMIYLVDLCNKRGWDLQAIVEETWDQVRTRDWVKHPKNGRTE